MKSTDSILAPPLPWQPEDPEEIKAQEESLREFEDKASQYPTADEALSRDWE